VQEPDIVLRVDGEARRISELELRWQPRPRRIDLEHRHAAGLRLRRLSRRLGGEKTCRWQTSSDDVRQQSNETESLALHGFLLRNEVRKLSDPSGVPLITNRTIGAGRRAAEQRDELAPFQWLHLPCFRSEDTTLPKCGGPTALRDFEGPEGRYGSSATEAIDAPSP